MPTDPRDSIQVIALLRRQLDLFMALATSIVCIQALGTLDATGILLVAAAVVVLVLLLVLLFFARIAEDER